MGTKGLPNQPLKKLVANDAKCRHCQTCMLVCSMLHESGQSSLQQARLRVEWSLDQHQARLTICNHCRRPMCIEVDCPTGAIGQDQKTGLVVIDPHDCIGCGQCKEACPFGAIIHDPVQGICKKCDLCEGRAEGPACVQFCPVGALRLKERESE